MTATTPDKATTRPAASDHLQPQEVDYSCRNPLLFLFTSSIVWLIFSLLTGIIASVKMHAPGMMADSAALTYGRVAAVSSNAFYYGFASQAAIGIALWLFARMARTFLVLPRCGLVAGIFWNIGVALGVIGIFAGEMTQHRLFEMPPWTALIFFAAFVIFGVSGILTFNARVDREVYPSNWFLLAAFFTLPWILSVAHLLLGRYVVRGVVEPAIAIWYANNFVWLWLGSIALAVIFYLVPKLSGQPLYSRSLAVFGFWFYLLCANALGFQNTPGLPAWLPTLSSVMFMMLLLPAAIFAVLWYQTWVGHNRAKKQKDAASKYVVFAAIGFLASVFLGLLASRPAVDEVIGLTIFQYGAAGWVNFAFVGMALFAAIVHIVPRLTEIDWPSARMSSLHYWLTVAGLVLVAGGMMLGGYVQGNGINNANKPFNEVARSIVPFIGINSIGLILLLVAQVALLGNMILMFKSFCVNCCGLGRKEVAQ